MTKVTKNVDLQRLTDKRIKLRSIRAKIGRRIQKLNAQISELSKAHVLNGFTENS